MQPDLIARLVVAAMQKFNSELRDANEWSGWEDNKAHRYVMEHGRQLYPIKKIASLASGVPVKDFSGGKYPGHANGLVLVTLGS